MNHLATDIGALELGHVVAGFDGALEAAGRQVGPVGPTHMFPHCISDGALEAARQVTAGPTSRWVQGRCM
jgi:hypothetical protein